MNLAKISASKNYILKVEQIEKFLTVSQNVFDVTDSICWNWNLNSKKKTIEELTESYI